MLVILPPQEAVIRRLMVQNQPWANISRTLSQEQILHKKRAGGVVQSISPEIKPHYPPKKEWGVGCQWLTHVILATWEAEIRRIKV
jgi:hypothetical protein